MMEVLKFDEGLKSFSINGDESRVIYFNPSDTSLITRINEVQKFFEQEKDNLSMVDETDSDAMCEKLVELDKLLREKTNYIFGSKVDEIVFGSQSAISLINGNFLFQNFIESVVPIITSSIAEENKKSQKRIGKYTSEVMKFE